MSTQMSLFASFFVIKAPQEDNEYVAIFELNDDVDYMEIISGQELSGLPPVLSTLL